MTKNTYVLIVSDKYYKTTRRILISAENSSSARDIGERLYIKKDREDIISVYPDLD